MNHVSYIFNTMATGDLEMQGTNTISCYVIDLHIVLQNIPILHLKSQSPNNIQQILQILPSVYIIVVRGILHDLSYL